MLLFMCISVCVIAGGKIYKVQNPDGSISYTDRPPTKQASDVSEVQLEGINNRIDPSIDAKGRADFLRIKDEDNFKEETRLKKRNKQLAVLQKALDKAKADLQQAEKIKAGDYIRTANGGARLSPAYLARVKKFEQAVQTAQTAINALD